MKAEDPEGEALEQGFENGQQVRLAQPLTGDNDLELGYAVHGIDVVEAFETILVALMNTVDADEA